MKKKSIYVIIAVVAVLAIILFVRVSKKKSKKVTKVNTESKKVSEKTNALSIMGKIPQFVIDQLDGFDEGEKLRHDGKIYQVVNGHWKLIE